MQAVIGMVYDNFRLFNGSVRAAIRATGPPGAMTALMALRKRVRKARIWAERIKEGDESPSPDIMHDVKDLSALERRAARAGKESPAACIRRVFRHSLPSLLLSVDFARLHYFHEIDGAPFAGPTLAATR